MQKSNGGGQNWGGGGATAQGWGNRWVNSGGVFNL